MPEHLKTVRWTADSDLSYASLGADDRRVVDGWLDHLRRWPDDEFARARTRRLKSDSDLYAFQTTTNDLILVFSATADEIRIDAILRAGWLKGFENVPYPATA